MAARQAARRQFLTAPHRPPSSLRISMRRTIRRSCSRRISRRFTIASALGSFSNVGESAPIALPVEDSKKRDRSTVLDDGNGIQEGATGRGFQKTRPTDVGCQTVYLGLGATGRGFQKTRPIITLLPPVVEVWVGRNGSRIPKNETDTESDAVEAALVKAQRVEDSKKRDRRMTTASRGRKTKAQRVEDSKKRDRF